MADFMESLIHEQDNLVQMGTIKYTKYQSLAAGLSNQSQCKNKFKDLKQQRDKEKNHLDTEISNSTNESYRSRRMKKNRERPTCGYFQGSHHEIYLFINNMEIITKIL